MENTFYYGDNLEILSHYIASESIDLVYFDPTNKEKWNECFQWYVDSVTKFRDTFAPRIKKFPDKV